MQMVLGVLSNEGEKASGNPQHETALGNQMRDEPELLSARPVLLTCGGHAIAAKMVIKQRLLSVSCSTN